MQELINEILQSPLSSLLTVCNLMLIESILSIDNALVLSIIVMKLPKHQQNRALKYGMLGAYIFRGICLMLAAFLIQIWWLKPLGGAYLLYIAFDNWKEHAPDSQGKIPENKGISFLKKIASPFWSAVIWVELLDLVFSIDNVFSAVAFSNNLLLVWLGVCMGILSMRLMAYRFIAWVERYPFLKKSAFLIIGILGFRLVFSVYEHFLPESALTLWMKNYGEILLSITTLCIFIAPILFHRYFKFPSANQKKT